MKVVLNWGRRYSLWVFNFGLACCAIEFIAASMARHDFIRLGVIPFAPGPRQADLMVVSGTVTDKMAPAVKRLYEQMPEPKYVISFGACSNCGGPYWDSYSVTKGVDQIIPVDVYVPGCPPRPEALLQGIIKLQEKIARESLGERYPGRRPSAAELQRGLVKQPPGSAAPGEGRPVTGWLPASAGELFGTEATAEESYGLLTVDVPALSWITALETARTTLGCTYFDWLSAVDEPGTGFRVSAHVVALAPVRRLLLRTTVPHEAPVLASAVGVYAGASWHERETHEMFGIAFEGHPHLVPLLLPDSFEGHPLRKDFVLAARVVKAWPGAKEPGESGHGGPRRRQMLPPGVPDPNEWGPHKGTLPAAPARGARAGGGAAPAGDRAPRGGPRAGGERPARRMRTAGGGSVSQAAGPSAAPESPAPGAESAPDTPSVPPGAAAQERSAGTGSRGAGPRRARSASEGSASQHDGAASPRGTDTSGRPGATASDGKERTPDDGLGGAPQDDVSNDAPQDVASLDDTQDDGLPGDTAPSAASVPKRDARSADAPWHHARPAFDEPRTDRPGTGQDADAPGNTLDDDTPDDDTPDDDTGDDDTPDDATPPGGPR